MSQDFFNKSEQLTNSILYAVVDSIPDENWESAQCEISFPSPDNCSVVAKYTLNGEEKTFETNVQVHLLAMDLEKLYTAQDKGSLKGVSFTITSDGKFDINFEY